MLSLKDEKFVQDAYKVASMLLSQKNLSPEEIPHSYVEVFNYTYEDGSVCGLSLLNKISLPVEYSEDQVDTLIRYLLKVNPDENAFSELDAVEEIPLESALSYIEADYENAFSEYSNDFAEGDLDSGRLATFMKRVISTIYTPGVTRLEEDPSAENNYLATKDDASEFKGAFFDGD
ncbi:MAG: hypothetical protein R3321_13385, partial [Nitrososphaeraceae archaeon]|nr:hypothetical protein [Nitrososphaeraceae archaeon]